MSRKPLYDDEPMVRVTLTIKRATRDSLHKVANKCGRPVSALVREILADSLPEMKRNILGEDAR